MEWPRGYNGGRGLIELQMLSATNDTEGLSIAPLHPEPCFHEANNGASEQGYGIQVTGTSNITQIPLGYLRSRVEGYGFTDRFLTTSAKWDGFSISSQDGM